jgi:hypothetical protein
VIQLGPKLLKQYELQEKQYPGIAAQPIPEITLRNQP